MDYNEHYQVLRHLVADKAFLDAARKQITEMNYFIAYPHFNSVFTILTHYADKINILPNVSSFASELPWVLQDDSVSEAYYPELMRLVGEALIAPPTTLNTHDMAHALRAKYDEYLYGLAHGFFQGGLIQTIDDLRTFIASAQYKLTVNPYKATKPMGLMELDPEEALSQVIRQPLGVPFMDRMLEGGLSPGELAAFLAPSGGGKSTLGCMALMRAVRRGIRCWYLSTEQRLAGDITTRIYSLAADVSKKEFRHGWGKVPENTKLKITNLREHINEYGKFVDLSKTEYSSIDGVFGDVVKAKNSGKEPGLIIVDWWGRLSDQLNLAAPKVATDNQKRLNDRNNLHKLKQMAEDLHCPILVMHQLSGAANARGPKARLSAADAQENKAFNNMFDFCFVAGAKNSDSVVNIATDKARGLANTTTQQKLNGEYCRFDDVLEYDELENKHIVESNTSTTTYKKPSIIRGQNLADLIPKGEF
jgi:hypothetical protein